MRAYRYLERPRFTVDLDFLIRRLKETSLKATADFNYLDYLEILKKVGKL
jgi:hypothetical protein